MKRSKTEETSYLSFTHHTGTVAEAVEQEEGSDARCLVLQY
jgi:hypothetical protein